MSAPDPELRELLSLIHAQHAQIEKVQAEILSTLAKVTFALDHSIPLEFVLEPSALCERAAVLAAALYKVPTPTLYQNRRSNKVAHPRQLAIYLLVHRGVSTQAAVEHFGLTDHATACYAAQAVQNRIDTDPGFAAEVQKALEAMPRNAIPKHPGGYWKHYASSSNGGASAAAEPTSAASVGRVVPASRSSL